VSASSYRVAASRYRDALDLLGRFRGPCLCGAHPDARHRQADVITGALLAGDTAEAVAEDYLPDGDVTATLEVAFACLATDPRLHRVTCQRATELDHAVWAGPDASGHDVHGR
jgi:hypothetical protein